MKRKIVISILIFLILATYAMFAKAAESSVTISTDTDSAKEGDIITVKISAQNEKGLNGIDSTIEYDENILELVESTLADPTNWSEWDSFPKLTAMWKTSTRETTAADIYKIKFKVKNIGNNESTEIKIKGTLSLNAGNDETFDNVTKKVNLIKENNNPSNSNNNNNSSSNATSTSGKNTSQKQIEASQENEKLVASSGKQQNVSEQTNKTSESQVTSKEVGATSSEKDVDSSTTAKTKLPAAGSKITTISVAIMIAITGIASVVFYKKYKEI